MLSQDQGKTSNSFSEVSLCLPSLLTSSPLDSCCLQASKAGENTDGEKSSFASAGQHEMESGRHYLQQVQVTIFSIIILLLLMVSSLHRVLEPSILMELTLSDGSVKTFEVRGQYNN